MPHRRTKRKSVDDVYEMEEITAYKQERNMDFYRIKWKNYDEADSTWEPKKNIINPDESQKERMHQLKHEWTALRNHSKGSKVSDNYDNDTSGGEGSESVNNNEEEIPKKKKMSKIEDNERILPSDFLSPIPNPNSSKEESSAKEDLHSQKASQENQFYDANCNATNGTEDPSHDKELNVPKVIRIREMSGKIFVQMRLPSEDNTSSSISKWFDLNEVRVDYSQELLVFLLGRLRFRRKGEKIN